MSAIISTIKSQVPSQMKTMSGKVKPYAVYESAFVMVPQQIQHVANQTYHQHAEHFTGVNPQTGVDPNITNDSDSNSNTTEQVSNKDSSWKFDLFNLSDGTLCYITPGRVFNESVYFLNMSQTMLSWSFSMVDIKSQLKSARNTLLKGANFLIGKVSCLFKKKQDGVVDDNKALNFVKTNFESLQALIADREDGADVEGTVEEVEEVAQEGEQLAREGEQLAQEGEEMSEDGADEVDDPFDLDEDDFKKYLDSL